MCSSDLKTLLKEKSVIMDHPKTGKKWHIMWCTKQTDPSAPLSSTSASIASEESVATIDDGEANSDALGVNIDVAAPTVAASTVAVIPEVTSPAASLTIEDERNFLTFQLEEALEFIDAQEKFHVYELKQQRAWLCRKFQEKLDSANFLIAQLMQQLKAETAMRTDTNAYAADICRRYALSGLMNIEDDAEEGDLDDNC